MEQMIYQKIFKLESSHSLQSSLKDTWKQTKQIKQKI